jgi:hypothetical protein
MIQGSLPATVSPFLNASVIAAALTAMVTAIGWFVVKWMDARGQARLKRAEFRRSYIQKQIEEFYGPLYSLVWQVIATNHLKVRISTHKDLRSEDRSAIEDYFATQHFLPIHQRIKGILETKLYLLDGTMMPESFYDYLSCALQESVQHELWAERNVSTSFMRGLPYPDAFQRTIYSSLEKLTHEYEMSVQELRGKDATKPEPAPKFDEEL